MKFLGMIEEDDGTLTLEAVDDTGTVHEFRNATITEFKESPSSTVTLIPLRYTVLTGDDVEPRDENERTG